MREIKFRAWLKDSHRMISLDLASLMFDDGDAKLVFGENFHDDFCDSSTKDFELMQFTGLQDAKGYDIYEGDILGASGETRTYFQIVWDEKHLAWAGESPWGGRFVLVENPVRNDDIVIGNIYEHPDLLK